MRQSNGQSSNDFKARLRRELRSGRQQLSAQRRADLDQAIRRHVLQLIESRHAHTIACYWPFNGEPDIIPLCKQLIAEGFELALPVVSDDPGHTMEFHPWRAETAMVQNKYGIFEPAKTKPITLSGFDILMIPLVGYDAEGNRLGMGAGYYDRYLEPLRDSPSPLRVGVAYSLQEIDLMNKNNWDISLHGVVNEHGWFTFVAA